MDHVAVAGPLRDLYSGNQIGHVLVFLLGQLLAEDGKARRTDRFGMVVDSSLQLYRIGIKYLLQIRKDEILAHSPSRRNLCTNGLSHQIDAHRSLERAECL